MLTYKLEIVLRLRLLLKDAIVMLLVIVALLESLNKPKNGNDFIATALSDGLLHIALDRLELCKLKYEFGEI